MPIKPESQKKNNPVRRTTMQRVTNQDLNDRLIRMEENLKPIVEQAARVPALQEAQIRTEGALKDHDSKVTVLFTKATESETGLGDLKREVSNSRATAKAVVSTLAAVVSLFLAVLGYFVSQQSSAMRDIVDNTSKTAGLVINLDKRLSLAEYELSKLQAMPASAVGERK